MLISSITAVVTLFWMLISICVILASGNWSGHGWESAPSEIKHRDLSEAGILLQQSGELEDPECNRICGKMTVPYPFGFSAECSLPDFQLVCKNISGVTGVDSPLYEFGYWPFLEEVANGSYQDISGTPHPLNSFQVLGINGSDGTLVIDTTHIKGMACNNSVGNASISFPETGPYRSTTSNVFASAGCSSYGQYHDVTGAISASCGPSSCHVHHVQNDKAFPFCGDFDCCSVSMGPMVNIYLSGGSTASTACGIGSVLYPQSYSTSNASTLGNGTYGMQLQYAIQVNETMYSGCSAIETTQDYLCSATPATCNFINATVLFSPSVPTLYGYYCVCAQEGYSGDGYRNGTGCQDINECANRTLHHCDLDSGAICINLEGSYNCTCPADKVGDGFRNPTDNFYRTGCSSIDKTKNNEALIIGLSVGGAFLILLLCILFLYIWSLWKRVSGLQKIQQELADRNVQPPFYSYGDIKIATRNFHKVNQLGKGTFGVVYKAILQDGVEVAVKRLFNSKKLQVLNEFLNEVVLITGIKHKNLVQLRGCCINDTERILVYEYAENGNVADALWENQSQPFLAEIDTRSKQLRPCLNWKQRVNICVGVARGLSYLHEELQPRIIHRDIKAANVLLDKNWNPKIADFGLAKTMLDEETKAQFTQISGTRGYFAPEYVLEGELTEKADVFSFGILVLEIISGRKCIDLKLTSDRFYLKNWAESLKEDGDLLELLQLELRQNCPKIEATGEAMKVMNIALSCIQNDRKRRPTMSQIVYMLTDIYNNCDTGIIGIANKDDKFTNLYTEEHLESEAFALTRNENDELSDTFSTPTTRSDKDGTAMEVLLSRFA